MGRRSDHNRAELEALILDAGHTLLAQVGFAQFSAREVAKRIGYSVGTVMNVFGSFDGLMLAINSRSFPLWADWLRDRLADKEGAARIEALVTGYFDFAVQNQNLWSAIYQHVLPVGYTMPDKLLEQRACLMQLVEEEILHFLPAYTSREAESLARSLVAMVHGHCSFALGGSFALLGIDDPLGLALARVGEVLRAHGGDFTR